jgi:calcium-dependent protein kinase
LKLSKLVGSPYYIAPEVFSEAYDSRCDLWSAGVLLYFMLSRQFPFQGKVPNEIYHNIKHGLLSFNGTAWENISDDAKDLISRLLVRDPRIRLSASEAL